MSKPACIYMKTTVLYSLSRMPLETTIFLLLYLVLKYHDITFSDRFFYLHFRLRNLKARDDAKIANARAKNSVESFLFETRDKLSDEEGETLMTEEEREKLETALSEASDWLDDEGWDATEDVSVSFLLHVFHNSCLVPRP